ncbi:MAG: Methyltransferase [Bacteroidetes bacterium]|nr:Methyltransferase [Bacteroidota bacterium]
MTIINNCPCCKNPTFEPFLKCQDFTVSSEIFQIVNCLSCGFKFTNPRPENEELGNYYKSESYISHTNTKAGIISKLYHLVRAYTLRQKIRLLSKYVSRGTILDYGCGTGMFLKECKSAGWYTFGLEPDQGARRVGKEIGIDSFGNKNELKKSLGNSQVDIITMWHVLEHVTDLDVTLDFFKENLKPKGSLVIAVPNYLSYDAIYYKEFWAAYDVPRHLYHFDITTICKVIEPYGFKLIDTQPMKFDSFYVSMLSEKYKNGFINYFRAFITGLRSNLKAKTNKDYSSVIYVFKKVE